MNRCVLVVDAVALALYLMAANPVLTGIPMHEWLGLGVLAVLFAHCAMHFGWLVRSAVNAGKTRSLGQALKPVLVAFTGATLVTCCVSGLAVSGTVLPAFGLYVSGYFFWAPVHAASAKLLLALVIVHVAMHVPPLWRAFGKRPS